MYTYEIFFSVNNQYSTVRINVASAGAAGISACAVSRLRGQNQLDQRD